jgi:DNA repair protein RadC
MNEGHRQRMTQRFLSEGLEGFEDREILEYMLFYVLPRVDTQPVAHRLLDAFGSLSGVLEASAYDLEQVDGVGKKTAAYLSAFPEMLRAYQRSRMGSRPSIKTVKDACEFAWSLLLGKAFEQFYVVWLDTQNRIIHFERLSEGGSSESPIYLNKLAAGALRHKAVKGIVAHNHPGGDPSPSKADISATVEIAKALGTLGVELLDHIIVCDDSSFSFQSDSLIKRSSENEDAYAALYPGAKLKELRGIRQP